MNILEIQSLTKTYHQIPALRSLTFQVPEGVRYGILGSAGAGKTTLLHTLLGFLKPTSGSIRLFGSTDLVAARARIGYIPSRLRYHRSYTPQEYLFFLGQFSDMEQTTLPQRISELLELVGLSHVATRALTTFLPGMLQRFGIAQALLSKPDLLLIDDPTHALDTASRKEWLELLQHTIGNGMTVLLCSQNSDDIEQLCDYAGILVDGYLIDELYMKDIQRSRNRLHIQVDALGPEVQTLLSQISPLVQCDEYTITLHPNSQWLQEAVIRVLLDAKVTIISMEASDHTLHWYYSEKVQEFLTQQRLLQSPDQSQEIPRNEQPSFHETDIAAPGNLSRAERGHSSHLLPTEETDVLLRELLRGSPPPHSHPSPSSNQAPPSNQERG